MGVAVRHDDLPTLVKTDGRTERSVTHQDGSRILRRTRFAIESSEPASSIGKKSHHMGEARGVLSELKSKRVERNLAAGRFDSSPPWRARPVKAGAASVIPPHTPLVRPTPPIPTRKENQRQPGAAGRQQVGKEGGNPLLPLIQCLGLGPGKTPWWKSLSNFNLRMSHVPSHRDALVRTHPAIAL